MTLNVIDERSEVHPTQYRNPLGTMNIYTTFHAKNEQSSTPRNCLHVQHFRSAQFTPNASVRCRNQSDLYLTKRQRKSVEVETKKKKRMALSVKNFVIEHKLEFAESAYINILSGLFIKK